MEEQNADAKRKWFGRGLYGSKDVPIRILDGAIFGLVLLTLVLIVCFALTGGYTITFHTGGGTEIASQKVKHGVLAQEPPVPVKPGYVFQGWYAGPDGEEKWNFETNMVQKSTELTAKWTPASVPVKLDLNGGTVNGAEEAEEFYVVYGEKYGALPVPQKEGAVFSGWQYSGQIIDENTTVFMTGEHVLIAQWK